MNAYKCLALAVASALITVSRPEYLRLPFAMLTFEFACNLGAIFLNLRASIKCCMMGVERILRSPTSFLDRTPVRTVVTSGDNSRRSSEGNELPQTTGRDLLC